MTVRKETGNDAKSKKILFKQNITFSLGVTRIEDLPKETSAEVAFFGRSNVGKSSLLNSITDKNKLADSGKIKDDYRITVYGKFLRKYWIDEFPMIINWFKRELKIVGVRPLSEDYFSRYPDDLKKLRIKSVSFNVKYIKKLGIIRIP